MTYTSDVGYPGTNPRGTDSTVSLDLTYDATVNDDGSLGSAIGTSLNLDYGEVVNVAAQHLMVDDRDRDFLARDTDAMISQPLYVVDPGTRVDLEYGGQAGRVDRNPYTMNAVVPFENFELTGRVLRIRRKPESSPGPVTGQVDYGLDHLSLLQLSLAQQGQHVPNDSMIALSMVNPVVIDEFPS